VIICVELVVIVVDPTVDKLAAAEEAVICVVTVKVVLATVPAPAVEEVVLETDEFIVDNVEASTVGVSEAETIVIVFIEPVVTDIWPVTVSVIPLEETMLLELVVSVMTVDVEVTCIPVASVVPLVIVADKKVPVATSTVSVVPEVPVAVAVLAVISVETSAVPPVTLAVTTVLEIVVPALAATEPDSLAIFVPLVTAPVVIVGLVVNSTVPVLKVMLAVAVAVLVEMVAVVTSPVTAVELLVVGVIEPVVPALTVNVTVSLVNIVALMLTVVLGLVVPALLVNETVSPVADVPLANAADENVVPVVNSTVCV
jgi:hypothetical protein